MGKRKVMSKFIASFIFIFFLFAMLGCSQGKQKSYKELSTEEQKSILNLISRIYKRAYGYGAHETVKYLLDPRSKKKLEKPILTISLISSNIWDSCEEITDKLKPLLNKQGIGPPEWSIFIDEYVIDCKPASRNSPAVIAIVPYSVSIIEGKLENKISPPEPRRYRSKEHVGLVGVCLFDGAWDKNCTKSRCITEGRLDVLAQPAYSLVEGSYIFGKEFKTICEYGCDHDVMGEDKLSGTAIEGAACKRARS